MERASAQRNRERRLARDRAYHARNREQRIAQNLEWRTKNEDRYREYQRRYYEANRERINARARQWLNDYPDESREHRRLATCRRRARLRDLPAEKFSLADLENRDGDAPCYLCGKPMERGDRHIDHLIPIAARAADLAAAGIESHPGSTLVNAALAHGSCNQVKGRRLLAIAVAKYQLNLQLR